LKVAPLTGRVD